MDKEAQLNEIRASASSLSPKNLDALLERVKTMVEAIEVEREYERNQHPQYN